MNIDSFSNVEDLEKLKQGFFGLEVPFMEYIGLEPVSIEPGIVRTKLRMRPELSNSRGHGHGGVLMSALDFTLASVARSNNPFKIGVSTIEMTTHFLSAATTDLIIEARILREGRRISFCEGDVVDAEGKIICTARAVCNLIMLDS